jgi:FkbM family methyltransferase
VALSSRRGIVPFYVRPFAPAISSLYEQATLPSKSRIIELMRDPNVSSSYKSSYPHWFNFLPRFLLMLLLNESLRRMRKTEEIRCEQSTISAVLGQENVAAIDILKLDVEEAELDVLLGIEQADWPKVRALVAEVHDQERRLDRILAMLAEQGFEHMLAEQEYVFRGTDIYDVYASRC